MSRDGLINRASSLVILNFTIARYLLLVIFIAIIIASFYIYYLIAVTKPPPVYVFDKNQIKQVVTLELPKISNEAVLRWASQAVSDIYSFSFADDLDKHFDRVSQYFTADGYEQYLSSLNDSGLLSDTKTKDISYTANSCDVVNVSNQREIFIDSVKNTVWYVDIPLIIKVESSDPTFLQRYIVRATIKGGDDVRADNSLGLVGINMLIAGKGVCSISNYY